MTKKPNYKKNVAMYDKISIETMTAKRQETTSSR